MQFFSPAKMLSISLAVSLPDTTIAMPYVNLGQQKSVASAAGILAENKGTD